MKIREVQANSRKSEFAITTRSGVTFVFPYSKCDPEPTRMNRVEVVSVDKELGNEGFTYVLDSGAEGSIHIDSVLEYNEDPKYMADLLLYKLSVEAEKRIEKSALSRRQIAQLVSDN